MGNLGVDCVADRPGVGENLNSALGVLCDVQAPYVIDFDQPIIQTILRYTGQNSR